MLELMLRVGVSLILFALMVLAIYKGGNKSDREKN